jgi:hypothetical protein
MRQISMDPKPDFTNNFTTESRVSDPFSLDTNPETAFEAEYRSESGSEFQGFNGQKLEKFAA